MPVAEYVGSCTEMAWSQKDVAPVLPPSLTLGVVLSLAELLTPHLKDGSPNSGLAGLAANGSQKYPGLCSCWRRYSIYASSLCSFLRNHREMAGRGFGVQRSSFLQASYSAALSLFPHL